MVRNVRVIKVEYRGRCLTCEEVIEVGETARWVPNVGLWHLNCGPLKNAVHYAKEQSELKRLGLL